MKNFAFVSITIVLVLSIGDFSCSRINNLNFSHRDIVRFEITRSTSKAYVCQSLSRNSSLDGTAILSENSSNRISESKSARWASKSDHNSS